MKRTLAYEGYLLIATLAVPWLTILAGGLTYGVLSPFLTSIKTPQQFLSDHLIFLVVVVGALLGYALSTTFTSRSALWVWIPATIVFVLRVLDWRAAGSALVGSGSFIEHFFTTNCQFNSWREAGFDSRCPDKLFLTPLFIGSLSYSAGAAIHRVIHYWRPPKDAPTTQVRAVPGQLQIVTTPLAALLALAFTGSVLGRRIHEEVAGQPSLWTWLGFGTLPTWLVVTFNIAIWGGIYAIGIQFARAPYRRDEKALFVSLVGSFMLLPVAALLPKTSGLIHIAQTMLSLTAFLAALAILFSFRTEHSGLPPSPP
ncbi:MAG: hypothetical protein WAU58_09195 [Terriglobales bacterium]